jgi:ATP-dependent RNA helicase DeaD
MDQPLQNPALARALSERGYTDLTPVQEAVMAPGAEARDLLVSAQTGSGKTVAYGLAFAATLLGGETQFANPGNPLALIIAPTRELAMQVHRELSWLYAHTGARIVSCIGGMDGQREGRALEAGCHIVVGTPGRLCDHLARGRLRLGDLAVVVLDEADEMLDLGFRDELDTLLDATPDWRRTLLFSATIAKEITALAKKYQKDALRIDTLVRNQPHADIEYRAVRTPPREIEHAVVNVLRFYESPTALVFCGTRDGVRHLHASLQERGFTSVALSGELTQNERTRALQAMRDGQARVCVATDVAARGLDLPDLGLVIHADLPTNKQTLLHRSGRTGRAGRKGICVLIVPANRARAAETLIAAAGVSASWAGPPLAEAIFAADGERLLADPVLTEDITPEDLALGDKLLAGRSAQDVAAALVRLYRSRLPAPEEITLLAPPPGTRGEKRPDSPGRAPSLGRDTQGPMVWFSLNVGRAQKADPKWLLPLICRMGGVEKRDVGAIRIQDRETRFEITEAAAEDFAANLPEDGKDEVRVTRSEAPAPAARRDPSAPKRFFKSTGPKHAGNEAQARRRKG